MGRGALAGLYEFFDHEERLENVRSHIINTLLDNRLAVGCDGRADAL